jgi:hypothetical protein
VDLAWSQDEADGIAESIDTDIDLGAQAAARTPDRLILARPFWAPAAYWWARTMVESMIRYSRSGSKPNAVKRRFQTPFFPHRRKRLNTLFHLPNCSGRSRQGAPARARRCAWQSHSLHPDSWPSERHPPGRGSDQRHTLRSVRSGCFVATHDAKTGRAPPAIDPSVGSPVATFDRFFAPESVCTDISILSWGRAVLCGVTQHELVRERRRKLHTHAPIPTFSFRPIVIEDSLAHLGQLTLQ